MSPPCTPPMSPVLSPRTPPPAPRRSRRGGFTNIYNSPPPLTRFPRWDAEYEDSLLVQIQQDQTITEIYAVLFQDLQSTAKSANASAVQAENSVEESSQDTVNEPPTLQVTDINSDHEVMDLDSCLQDSDNVQDIDNNTPATICKTVDNNVSKGSGKRSFDIFIDHDNDTPDKHDGVTGKGVKGKGKGKKNLGKGLKRQRQL